LFSSLLGENPFEPESRSTVVGAIERLGILPPQIIHVNPFNFNQE
jgi:hypothetical protein